MMNGKIKSCVSPINSLAQEFAIFAKPVSKNVAVTQFIQSGGYIDGEIKGIFHYI